MLLFRFHPLKRLRFNRPCPLPPAFYFSQRSFPIFQVDSAISPSLWSAAERIVVMKSRILLATLLAFLYCFSLEDVQSAPAPRLRVTANHRYLEYENGKPFFYLGDTAWELFHRLNREEASEYLSNRARKGFTVIQASVLSGIDGSTAPNAYGDAPFRNGDPAQPNEAYFRQVDFIVDKAAELGLFVGMLPSWGSHWAAGTGILNIKNAREYGRFL